MTSPDERALLLLVAREAIAAHLSSTAPSARALTGVLGRCLGAFVTIHNHGDLRGCIGHIEADEPLGRVIPRCAVAASTTDPRFPAVSPSELADIDVEISLLGPLEPIEAAAQVEIGRHGLVVEQGWNRGLLLPQVATRYRLTAQQFLRALAKKSGMDAEQPGARLYLFEAQVFRG